MNSYPKLLEACRLIAYDNGFEEPTSISLKGVMEEDLECAELGLKELNDDDFEIFCIGAEHEQAPFTMLSTGLAVAHNILNEYFDSLS
jgi:hypothetical protein